MRQILALAVIAVAIFLTYRLHVDRVKSAAAEAAEAALAKSRATTPRPKTVPISQVIEPSYLELFSDLNPEFPTDLVPSLEITKGRILDKQQAEAGNDDVHTAGINLLKGMIGVAEVRTQALSDLLEANAMPLNRLDGPTSTTSSSTFFVQTVANRWKSERQRRKPALDQLFGALRQKEGEWKKRNGEGGPLEVRDLPKFSPVFVTIDPSLSAPSPLQRGSYNQRRVVYPWRAAYYNQYNYRGY